MKNLLILTFIFLVILSSSVLAGQETFIEDIEWGMNKSEVIENINLQIINSSSEKRDGTSFSTLVYNGDFVNSRGNYQLFFINDQLYSILRLLFTGEEDIAENYYKKWNLDLKPKDNNYPGDNLEEKIDRGLKGLLLNNSGYEGNIYLIDLNKADLSEYNINKSNIPKSIKYMVTHDILNKSVSVRAQ